MSPGAPPATERSGVETTASCSLSRDRRSSKVIEGPAGSPWDATAGPRCDHLGYWSEDIAVDKQRLAERGAPLEFDSCPYGRSFTYHRLDSLGTRLELVDQAVQPDFLATWKSGAAPIPAIDLGDGSTRRDAGANP